MLSEETHLSDQELLSAVDGELRAGDRERIESHLTACWPCRARKQELEGVIAGFINAYREDLDAKLPPAAGPRALLKAHLAERSRSRPAPLPRWPMAAAACVVVAVGAVLLWPSLANRSARERALAIPNPDLTPGAAVLAGRSEVCRESNSKNKEVPVALRRRVFEEYGISHAEPRAYEVDYLITPALGGADDIHNLWPQSYRNTVWNAQVKDALEDHLRELVCDGQLDLVTAQREIATNWIEAYKRYFHTDRPVGRVQ